jgi:hypothetical protein
VDDDLKPGDRVKLGGRGPDLVVEGVTAVNDVVMVRVVWLDQDDRLCRSELRRDCLTAGD